MEWDYQEINHLITEYDSVSDELLNSDNSSFSSNIKRFIHLLNDHEYFIYVNEVVLPNVNFNEWYSNACTTVKSMVGSGPLEWPIERKEYLSMQLSLLNYIADGKEDPPNLCSKFMYAGTYLDDCVDKVNEQITEGFIRNYKLLFINTAEQAISELGETKENNTSTHAWYQRPIGMVLLGVIVTVIGGLILLKITGN